MKKRLKCSKGFAMAELLAVCLIVLVLFSVLFSNYLPLVAQYENRINYNDTTAEYASFYVRKVYNEALKDINIQNQIDEKIKNGYYTVYSKESNIKDYSFLKSEIDLDNIISEYSIEEMIITSNNLSTVKEKYERNKSLYNYIKYLPSNANNEEDIEKYRILLKTSNYGYSETEILTDNKTPVECFKLNGTTITDYLCGKNNTNGKQVVLDVVIPNKINGITIKTIGEKAFKDKGITSIDFGAAIEAIEKSAFENNNITHFDFMKKGSELKKVGEKAFMNNDLKEVTILSNIEYDKLVFANNYNINKISFSNNKDNSIRTIPDSMFSLDKQGNKDLNITVPKTIEKIGKEAFKNLKIKKLEFIPNNSSLTIGEKAFESNSLETVILPPNLNEGLNIFGDSSIGSTRNQIFLNAKTLEDANDMFVGVNWCLILYGNNCNGEPTENSEIYKYTYNGLNKYISYIKGDDTY